MGCHGTSIEPCSLSSSFFPGNETGLVCLAAAETAQTDLARCHHAQIHGSQGAGTNSAGPVSVLGADPTCPPPKSQRIIYSAASGSFRLHATMEAPAIRQYPATPPCHPVHPFTSPWEVAFLQQTAGKRCRPQNPAPTLGSKLKEPRGVCHSRPPTPDTTTHKWLHTHVRNTP